MASQLLSVSLHDDPTSSALLLPCPTSPTLPTVFSPRFGCAVLPFAIRAEQMEVSPSFHVEPWTSSLWPRWSQHLSPSSSVVERSRSSIPAQVRPAWYCPGETHLWWSWKQEKTPIQRLSQPCTLPLDSAQHWPSSVAPWLCHRAHNAALQRHSLAEAEGLAV